MSAGEFVPPSPEALDALLPDCTVESLLAQGGMGAIYRGLQTKLDRPVAIKVLPKSHGADLDYANRFEQEAKAMAKLSHNNIVGVYDYGETSDGTMLYFIMEFVEGADLYHLLQEKAIRYSEALPLISQICDALQYAHTNGIVHRDIKPANILIDKHGVVKMADFGLAKMQRSEIEDLDGAGSDTAFGTPDYIAPEALIEGIEVDHRADIYSLGVVIYEILTGQVPRGTFDLPSTLNPEIDRRLDDVIVRAMSHDRDLRYPEVSEIKKVLTAVEKTPRLVTGGGGPAAKVAVRAAGHTAPVVVAPVMPGAGVRRAAPPSKSSNLSAILALLFLLALAGGGAFYFVVVRPGAEATGDPGIAAASDPASNTSSIPIVEINPSPKADTGNTPSGESAPPGEPEIFVPTPKPIVPVPYAGKLRAFGSQLGMDQIDLSRADGLDDIAKIRARDRNWQALRLNGELVSSSDGENGLTNVRWMDSRNGLFRAVRGDGAVWFGTDRKFLGGLLENVVMCFGGAGHHEALLAGGTLAVWGKMYGSTGPTLGTPPREFVNLVDLASLPNVVGLLEKDGTLHVYNNNGESATREPQTEGERIVDIEPSGGDFVALTESGRAFSWPGIRIDEPHSLPPQVESEYCVKIRGGDSVKAAQKADGTWVAWGNKKWGVIDKIESLPPTPDIAMAVQDEFGFLFWIEPNPAYMPGDDYTSTAKPGSEVPFFSETVDLGGASSMPPSPGAPGLPEVDPSTLSGTDRIIAELRQKVISRHGAMVRDPYLASLDELNEKYVPALERTAAAALEKGDAFTAKAVSDDIAKASRTVEAAAANGSAPVLVTEVPDSTGIPADLRNLRETYRREYEKLAEQRDTNARAVLNTYITDLELLESQLESSGGTAEAAPVKTAIEAARAAGLDLFQ